METKKMMIVLVVAATVLCGISMAGTRINQLVFDDFESYADVTEMKATFGGAGTSGGPWWLLQELQTILNGGDSTGIIAPGAILEIDLVGSAADPNGFLIAGDPAPGPQAVKVHYDFSNAYDNTGGAVEWWNCDLFTMVNNLGIPYSYVPTGYPSGHPLEYLPVADLSKYDTLLLKIKKSSYNTANRNGFGLALIGPDTLEIGYLDAVGGEGRGDFLNVSDSKWQTLEFDISSIPDAGAPSAFGLDMVTGIILGMADTIGGNEKATIYIDDITLTIKDDPADINMDGAKNLLDLVELASKWLQ